MLISSSKGKTKFLCECGAQTPKISDEAIRDWRSREGKEWLSRHTPHGKSRRIEAGREGVSLEDSLRKIDAKRTQASKAELEELADRFNQEG